MDEKSVAKSLQKFAESLADESANKFGITNNRGQIVTTAYLARYIQCWCRQGNGYVKDRKVNFAYFMSDEFLGAHPGKTASQIGKIASLDPRWGIHKPVTAADVPATVAEQPLPDGAVESQPAGEPVAPAKRMTKAERVALAEKVLKEKQIEVLRATIDDPAAAAAVVDLTKQVEALA